MTEKQKDQDQDQPVSPPPEAARLGALEAAYKEAEIAIEFFTSLSNERLARAEAAEAQRDGMLTLHACQGQEPLVAAQWRTIWQLQDEVKRIADQLTDLRTERDKALAERLPSQLRVLLKAAGERLAANEAELAQLTTEVAAITTARDEAKNRWDYWHAEALGLLKERDTLRAQLAEVTQTTAHMRQALEAARLTFDSSHPVRDQIEAVLAMSPLPQPEPQS